LEFSSGRRVGQTGMLLRRTGDGPIEILLSEPSFPTALAFGPDGALYFSESGHQSEDGSGRVLRLRLATAASAA
jgi:hypothetical protein